MTEDRIKTPYYMIDKSILANGLEKLNSALKHAWGNYIIGYSYKTNALPWIINFFKENGCYAEVVSDDEYALADSIKVDKRKIIYNGIAKSRETFLEAVRNHAIVNIDSWYEIEWLDELKEEIYEVGIRINFDLGGRYPGHEQCPEEGGRFGFCYENGELEKAIKRIEGKGVHIAGIHLHTSSRTRMPEVYKAIAEVAVEVGQKYNLDLAYVDVGGGFFGGLEYKPQFPEYFDMLSGILRQYYSPDKTALIVEPGNALIAPAVDLMTTVLDVKKTEKSIFVNTDGSRILVDPLMTKKSYFHEFKLKDNSERSTIKKQIISGFTCMEHDRLFTIDGGTELLPGDQIIYHKVGAYTMCLSPLFIKWFPDVYVYDNGNLQRIRDRWKAEDYKSRSTII
ncbi:MAG: pyridoxal-dependent decarboxylase [Lachnospiraceae bacterium]|nr:pyridoxal-dependent decarboxylase [Lachnospiraceae bacterium]